MQFHNLRFLPATLTEQLDKDVKANRMGYLTRHLPVSTALAVASVPIYLKAKSLNLAHPTVESSVFLLASAFVMFVFIDSAVVVAFNLWITRPGVQKEK